MADRKTVHLQQGDNAEGKSDDRAMPPVLVPIMAVGMTSVPGGVCLLGKDTVVYPVARSLAMYCPSQLSAVRISEPLRAIRGISALALAPNKKYVAAAESMADGYLPQITLFDATTLERCLSLTGTPATAAVTYLAFSADSSLLLATAVEDSSPPVSTFHLWDWANFATPRCSGVMSTGELAIRAALDPRYEANVLVVCAKSLGLFRQSPNGFKRHPVDGLEMASNAAFVDLATLSDGRFLVASSSRQVFLVDRTHAHVAFFTDRPVTCMVGLPDGAVAVGTERGYLQLYRRAPNSETTLFSIYSETRVPETLLSVSLDNQIRGMSVGPGGETLLCATAGGGPTYLFNLAYARTLALSTDSGSDLWEVLLPGCHEQGIISASLAYKRDFLATASKDLTVRVWQTSPLRLVLTHMCHHSPLSLSIDPYGRELVVAYVDGVRCYSIVEGLLVEGEELYHEFGPTAGGPGGISSLIAGSAGAGSGGGAAASSRRRGGDTAGGAGGWSSLDHCSLVRYSPTGALIAAAGGPSGRHVYIFSTLTKRQLAVLAGHYEAVLDVAWSDDGLYLATAGEGAVFTWAMDGFSRVQENTSKLYLNDAVASTPDFRTLVVGDTTQGLRIMETTRTTSPSGPGGATEPEPPDAPEDVINGGAAAAAAASGGSLAGGAGGSPGGGDVFRVPGRASLVPIGADGGFATMTRKAQMFRLASSARGPGGDAASGGGGGGGANGLAGPELKLRTALGSIMQPTRGGLAIARCGPVAGLGSGYAVVLGTGVLGRVRMCPLRPRGNDDVDTYFLHAADVTQVVAHRDGRLIFTTDASGCWMMHVLLPSGTPTAWLAAAAAAVVAGGSNSAPAPTPTPAAPVSVSPMPGVVPSSGPLSPNRASSSIRQSAGGAVASGGGTASRQSMAGNRSGSSLGGAAGQLSVHTERTAAAQRMLQYIGTVLAVNGGARGGAGGVMAAAAPGGGGDGSTSGGTAPAAQLIVSVRALDMQNLKESQRELKDRLAKAATEAEYKMYEREQGVRREFEGEVNRLRHEVDVLRADLEYTRTTANDEASASQRLKTAMTRDFERALREQQDMFEKKLAAEISRTDAAEREMQRLRAKFGRKLWALDEQQGAIVLEATERQTALQQVIESTKQEAQKAIGAAHIQTEQELRIDGELNEEELQRAADAAQKQLEEKDEAYLKLLGKHTLQSGLNAKTTQENERLRTEAEALRKENTRLAEQVMALSEELEAMQAAWADRDVRQRHQDAEMKDMAFQWQQSQLFSTLATSRIKELNNELEPIKAGRTEALVHVAKMESVAQRQLERQAKVVSENGSLQSRLDAAYEELKKVKADTMEREAYFKNFTTQLFRTIQDVPHHQWPKLFGRLIDDYHKDRDKASWTRYLTPDHGPNAHPPATEESAWAGNGSVGGESASATATEYQEKIAELHAQLMHTEKMLSLLTETKDKADQARRAVVSKLMTDNLMAVQELNDVKRDLKAAREVAEKRAIELADMRMNLAVAGVLPSQLVSQASLAQSQGSGGGGNSSVSNSGNSASGGSSSGAAGEGLPQGPAGRAMARLPSRFSSDASKHTPGGGGGGSASTEQHSSAPSGPPHPAMVVTGEMPQGGWWLGDSPFELPASLDHLTSSSLRQRSINSSYDGGGGGGERPPTGLLGRRPATSASSGAAGIGRIFGSSRSSLTPPGPHGSLPPRQRPETSSPVDRNLVAAAVSGAALQAYKQQQQQSGGDGVVPATPTEGGGGGDGATAGAAPAAGTANGGGSGPVLQRTLSPPSHSRPHPHSQQRAASAGPTYSSATFNVGLQPSHHVQHGQPRVRSSSAVQTVALGSGAPSTPSSPYGLGSSLLPPGMTIPFLQGQVRPSTTSKVTTMGAGFRSFVPTQVSNAGGKRGTSGR